MKTIKIYGASDDCICIEGDIKEEFYLAEDGSAIASSDGTLLLIDYCMGGLWKITVAKRGACELEKFEAIDPDSEDYSDIVTLKGDIDFIVCGKAAK